MPLSVTKSERMILGVLTLLVVLGLLGLLVL
jgi:hypothetical protein